MIGLLLVALVVALVLRAPSAVGDFTSAFEHIEPVRIPWLAAAVAAEFVSFVFYARIQRTLLASGGDHVPTHVVFRLSIASSGLRALLPAGVVPSSGWLYEQYRQLGTSQALSAYVVLASGFVSTVTILGLLLIAAAIGSVAPAPLLGASGAVLVVGSAGFVAAVHRLPSLERRVGSGSGRLAGLVRRAADFTKGVALQRPGWRRGAITFADAAGNWLADVVCLIVSFLLLAQHVPWRGLLFAYCAAQLAGSIVPLPGGLGAVEGGLVGGLALTGVPAGSALAAAVVYRVVTYWGVALIGMLELATFVRHPLSPGDVRRDGPAPGEGQAPAGGGRAEPTGGGRAEPAGGGQAEPAGAGQRNSRRSTCDHSGP